MEASLPPPDCDAQRKRNDISDSFSTGFDGSGNPLELQCCVGPPMINSDGTAYFEYEVRNVNRSQIVTSDYLYLGSVSPLNVFNGGVLPEFYNPEPESTPRPSYP